MEKTDLLSSETSKTHAVLRREHGKCSHLKCFHQRDVFFFNLRKESAFTDLQNLTGIYSTSPRTQRNQ